MYMKISFKNLYHCIYYTSYKTGLVWVTVKDTKVYPGQVEVLKGIFIISDSMFFGGGLRGGWLGGLMSLLVIVNL